MLMGGIFSAVKNLDNSTLFELHILTAFHFDRHWTGVMDSCGVQVTYGGREITCCCVQPFLSSLHYSNKKYDRRGKTFQHILLLFHACLYFTMLCYQQNPPLN